jgi:hypothetical protein
MKNTTQQNKYMANSVIGNSEDLVLGPNSNAHKLTVLKCNVLKVSQKKDSGIKEYHSFHLHEL